MSRIQEIATKANVSISTVSRVFNDSGYVAEDKRTAVYNAAKQLGYKTPKKTKGEYDKMVSDVVGIVVPDINNPFFSESIKGVMKIMRQNDIHILICDTDESPELEIQSLQTLRRQKVGGQIITPVSSAV